MVTSSLVANALARRIGVLAHLADVPGALAYGARWLGLSLADPTTVSDVDLTPLSDDQGDVLVDLALCRALADLPANVTSLELHRAGIADPVQDVKREIRERAREQREFVRRAYNFGEAPLVTGSIDMDFASRGDDATPGGNF